jgi:O-antigen ligase
MNRIEAATQRLIFAGAIAFAALAPWSVAGMQITGGIAAGATVLLSARRFRGVNPLHVPALAFIAAAAFAWAVNPFAPTPDSLMPRAVLGAVVATGVVIAGGPEGAFRVTAVLVASEAAVSLLALYQVRTGFDLLHALHLRAEAQSLEAPDAPGFFAAMGTYSKRLTYAHVATIVAAFAGGALVHGGLMRRWKALFAVAGCVIAAGVVAAYARSALLSLAGGIVVTFVVRGMRIRRAILPISAVTLALLAALAVVPGAAKRITGTLNLKSNQDRVFIWERASEMLADAPVFGVGPGAYPERAKPSYDFWNPRFPMHTWAHDSFLSLWLELGVLGLVAFIALFVVYFTAIRERLRAAEPTVESALRFGSIASTVTFLLLCLFHDIPYSVLPSGLAFFLMGLGVAPPVPAPEAFAVPETDDEGAVA